MAETHFIDPEVRPVLDMLAKQFGDYTQLSVEETRKLYQQTAAATAAPLPEACIDGRFEVPGPAGPIQCRYFKPRDAEGPLPVFLYFLGGTFVATSLDYLGPVPPALALTTNAIVVTPLHRVPPEHRFPAAYDDCLAVYAWARRAASQIGGDSARVAVGGQSSGGTLAAAVCIDARDSGLPQPELQVLAEPLLDHLSETPSLNEFSYVLSKQVLRHGSSLYFGDAPAPGRASPLRAPSLAGLAPAYVMTAGLDPLRDEGLAFVARLRAEGGIVAHRHHEGQIHGFFSMFPQITQAKIAFRECCAVIQLAFESGLSGANTNF